MGVFDEMPLDGSAISVEVLAARLKVDKELLGMCLLGLSLRLRFLHLI